MFGDSNEDSEPDEDEAKKATKKKISAKPAIPKVNPLEKD